LLKQLGRHGAPWVEGVLFSLAVDSGALVPNMRRAMHISAESAARSREEIDAIFDEVSATLEGKAFIVGDRFTAADLTFASLASPLLSVPQFAAIFPPHRFPPQLQSTTQALRATPAGQHALKCYASFRFASLAPDGMNLLPSDPSANLQRPLTIRSGGPRNNFLALTAAVLVVATPCALIVQQLYTRRAIDANRSNTGS